MDDYKIVENSLQNQYETVVTVHVFAFRTEVQGQLDVSIITLVIRERSLCGPGEYFIYYRNSECRPCHFELMECEEHFTGMVNVNKAQLSK